MGKAGDTVLQRGERTYDDLAKCLDDAAGWSGEDYEKNASYVSTILRQAASSIGELIHYTHAATERLCCWCGVCPEGKQDALDCEIADLNNESGWA